MANTNAIDLSKNPQSQSPESISFTIETDPQINEAVFKALTDKFYECHEDIWMSMELLSVELRNE